MHIEVIRGHLRGQKRSFWGQKSEKWPNAHDMHIDRLEILFQIQWCVSRGHPRSSKGSKRSFWGQKSEIWPNAHDMHIDRLEILFLI